MNKFKTLLFFVGLSAIIMSCGDKDDPAPKLEDVQFGLFEEGQTISVPQGIATSSDSHAKAVASTLAQMNVQSYSALFTIPDNANKIDGPIEAANGRMNTNTVTYEWTYDGDAIAYQISELDDSYFFELFIKNAGDDAYYKWFEGTQAKDGKSGSFVILEPSGTTRVVQLEYSFEFRSDGVFFMEYSVPSQDFYWQALVNADNSGSMKYLQGTTVLQEYTWDAAGNGTWTEYDSDGTIVDSGTWTAGS